MDSKKTTKQIFEEIFNCDDLKKYMEDNGNNFINREFHEYLEKLMKQKKASKTRLIKRSNIEKSYIYQILNGRRNPSRDKIVRIALATNLSLDETQKLLTMGNKSILYPRRGRDAALVCCIMNKYTLVKTQEFLYDLGYDVLE